MNLYSFFAFLNIINPLNLFDFNLINFNQNKDYLRKLAIEQLPTIV